MQTNLIRVVIERGADSLLIVEDTGGNSNTTHVALGRAAGIPKNRLVGGFATRGWDGDDINYAGGKSAETGTMLYAEFEQAKRRGIRLIRA